MSVLKTKSRKEQGSSLQTILFSVTIGCLFFLIFLAIGAIVVSNTNLDLSYLKYILYIAFPFCVLISSMFSGYKAKNMKGILSGLLSGTITVVILLAVILAVNAGNVDIKTIFIFPLSIIVGLPGGILGANLR